MIWIHGGIFPAERECHRASRRRSGSREGFATTWHLHPQLLHLWRDEADLKGNFGVVVFLSRSSVCLEIGEYKSPIWVSARFSLPAEPSLDRCGQQGDGLAYLSYSIAKSSGPELPGSRGAAFFIRSRSRCEGSGSQLPLQLGPPGKAVNLPTAQLTCQAHM